MIGRLVVPGLVLALLITSAVTGQSPSAAPDASPSTAPSPAPTISVSPDPAQAAMCLDFGLDVQRCYAVGSARITMRGAVRRSVTVSLRMGERGAVDLIPSIYLQYGFQGPASLEIHLPAVPGESTTPASGVDAAIGGARLRWSLVGPVADYGHGCTVRYDADAVGRLTGSIRCPDERTRKGQRYRVEVVFEAIPALPVPLPTPMPSQAPATPIPADPICALLDGPVIESVLGLESGSVLLLGAGPGQCAAIAVDREVAFVSVREGAIATDLVGGGTFRGASCTPLPLASLGDAASAGSCAWPDGRAFVVGSVLRGSALLAISLASNELTSDDLLTAVSGLLATALDRLL